MDVKNERLQYQMMCAGGRYASNKAIRESRTLASDSLSNRDNLNKIDSIERIVRRLRSVDKVSRVTDIFSEKNIHPKESNLNLLERIIGKNDFLGAVFLPHGAIARRSVGRIIFSSTGYGFGTGFMISPELLMTNNHVLSNPSMASQCAIEFDYYERQGGGFGNTEVFELNPARFFETDEDLDFSIIAVQTTNAQGVTLERGWSSLIPESGKALVTERVNIIQHPDGGPQQLALRANEVIDVPGDFLHYVSDTRPGSSGSPVFNDQWELAALHHSGIPDRDDNGNILLDDGTVWDGSDQDKIRIKWVANEGVRISSIVEHLAAFVIPILNDNERSLIEAAIASEQVFSSESFGHAINVAGTSRNSTTVIGIPDTNTSTLSIPLQVQIGFANTFPDPSAYRVQSSVPSKTLVRPTSTVNISKSIESIAQERLNRFRDKPYYDESVDQANSEEYYADLPNSAYPEEWYQLVSDLISKTHTTKLSYKRARLEYLYPWVDLHETESDTSTVKSIYSGQSFNALDVITEEFLNERKRMETVKELRLGDSAISNERLEVQLELLEARFPFNCEHVVPQSWYSKREPMKSDLHHLFTCEWNCNSFRSNVPYFDFSDFEERIMEMCGKRESEGFEPKAGKGAVARATLYFLLRYPKVVDDDHKTDLFDNIDTLIDWHKSESVSRYELHRNAAIYEIQGNRNPLIDWPEVSDLVSFI